MQLTAVLTHPGFLDLFFRLLGGLFKSGNRRTNTGSRRSRRRKKNSALLPVYRDYKTKSLVWIFLSLSRPLVALPRHNKSIIPASQNIFYLGNLDFAFL